MSSVQKATSKWGENVMSENVKNIRTAKQTCIGKYHFLCWLTTFIFRKGNNVRTNSKRKICELQALD